jgi:predicted dehydrogenase
MPATRRRFLAAAAGAPAFLRSASPNEKFVVACMGIRGRGKTLLLDFAALPNVEVAVACDIDSRLFDQRLAEVEKRQGRPPRTVTDFRRLLDDKSIDAVVMGTPDHWHAIPAILACQAGKHVYVEKPAGHTLREGRAMAAAARRYNRVMQVGIQSRSGRHFAQACDYIRSGGIGKVVLAKAWESARQSPVTPKPDGAPPPGVDYDLWLGPAPERPFNPNRFHSNWRWFFDYGCGDLGNDGVHRIDYARRGLGAGFEAQGRRLPDWPVAVSASGGKHYFDDAQEWPDTMVVTWEYPGATLMYEMRIWSPYPMEGEEEGAAIYGDNGYVVIGNSGWRAYGPQGVPGPAGKSDNAEHDRAHKLDFLECIQSGGRPACDIEIGHVASGYTHLGNIAWRVGRKLRFDATAERFVGDEEANALLGRAYRAPWVLPEA